MEATTLRQLILYLAIELSNSKWKLFFSHGEKIRSKSIEARDLKGLSQEVESAKQRFKLAGDVSVVSCYEAGRDGFWIHRHGTAVASGTSGFPGLPGNSWSNPCPHTRLNPRCEQCSAVNRLD